MAFKLGIFGGGNQQQQPQQQVPQQQAPAPQQQAQPGAQTPGAAPGAAGPASQQQAPQNTQQPLDQLLGLMTPKQPAEGQQQQPKEFSVFGEVDPKAIEGQVRAASFTNGIDQAKVQAALGGDQAAFMEVLNSVAQNAFLGSMNMSRQFTEHGAKRAQEHMTGQLDSHFRNYQLKSQNIETDNPALQHPVGQSMVRGIAAQIANANPGMTAEEVHKQALQSVQDFLKIGGQPFFAPPAEGTPGGAKKEADWSSWLN